MNILEALRNKRGFTDTEAALADYVMAHVDDVTEMTIGSLAQLSHSSSTSIVRLCQKLGLGGYRDLRIELAREMERSRSNMLDVNPDKPFIEGSATADIARSIATLSKQALDATYASISLQEVRKAARLILSSRSVVYYAIGDSCASAEVFSQLLYKIGVTCVSGLPRGDHGVFERMLGTRDIAIIISYSGRIVTDYAKTFNLLRASGCKTIVVTADRSLKDRLVGTDCFFALPQGESRSERLASFFSQECIRYVLNCIYAEAFSANYQQNLTRWQDAIRIMEGE